MEAADEHVQYMPRHSRAGTLCQQPDWLTKWERGGKVSGRKGRRSGEKKDLREEWEKI